MNPTPTRLLALAALTSIALVSGAKNAHAGEAYTVTVNQPSSALTYTFTTANPFTGTLTGSPGDATAVPPVPPTRLKRGTTGGFCFLVSGCSTIAAGVNDAIVISGSVTSSASTGTTVIRPAGTFTLSLDPFAMTSTARNLTTNLLASGPISASASLSGLTYQPFCAIVGAAAGTPFCTAFYCTPLTIPFGTATVTSLTAVQQGVGTGTLTATANPEAFEFDIPMTLLVNGVVDFAGTTGPIDPQVVPAALTGTITRIGGGTSATVTSTLTFSTNQTTTPNPPTPSPATPMTLPADSPVCANLDAVANITLTSSTVNTTSSAALVAAGPRLPCKCDTNSSGGVTIDDLFIYFNLWFTSAPGSDFNGVDGTTIDDLFLYLNCYFAQPFPC